MKKKQEIKVTIKKHNKHQKNIEYWEILRKTQK